MLRMTLIALLFISATYSGGMDCTQTNLKAPLQYQTETLGGPAPPLCAPGNVCPPQ